MSVSSTSRWLVLALSVASLTACGPEGDEGADEGGCCPPAVSVVVLDGSTGEPAAQGLVVCEGYGACTTGATGMQACGFGVNSGLYSLEVSAPGFDAQTLEVEVDDYGAFDEFGCYCAYAPRVITVSLVPSD
ncbi:hypothetical protein PPSIR1_14970 [Plesiocystis pacifica SIR-1]|uniref:Carboxypeptidase regulatory-like domain-containing protein n=1 Tax=Plesiocystis pacifica SIR-1 TaxID=391625 RepID=A6G6C1_9BACT|nr:hypothetical protein [Plesiocystis pacifica]EDM78550.1 hypothetical protein PPSIR1_14970 [Plesiocystis pacifica SIR-1]